MSKTGITGERLLVAATLDPVEEGQRFAKIPPHMTIVRWFSLPKEHWGEFWNEADILLSNRDLFQNLKGGRLLQFGENGDVPVREMLRVETYPNVALNALVKSLGKFPDDDPFTDTFAPHVTITPGREVARGEMIQIPTVAVFAGHSDIYEKVVKATFPIGDPRG